MLAYGIQSVGKDGNNLMRSTRTTFVAWLGLTLGLPTLGFAQAPLPATLRNYRAVTAERLKNPEDGNWLMNRRTYDGWGYSPLDQITPANVSRLRPVWVFSTNDGKPHESAPLVNNGVMFVTSPANQVIAIDVKSGNLLWRYKQSRPAGSNSIIFNDTNRGVALYEDKVYYALPESVLVALNAKTGKEVWRTTIADYKAGYYVTLAPLIADGKVMVGASGGESGIRGFVAAFSADTGKEIWRTFTIPAPGEPGSETWPKGDQWKPRRHAGLGYRQLRPADQSCLLGNWKSRALYRRSTYRRRSLQLLDAGD